LFPAALFAGETQSTPSVNPLNFYLFAVVGILFVLPTVLAALYHLVLGIIGLCLTHKVQQFDTPKTRFAVLIPAHNEENGILNTLHNLHYKLDYPKELLDIYVVADNCNDSTAKIAYSGIPIDEKSEHQRFEEISKIDDDYNVKVLERFDDVNRGKGYALNYAIPMILNETQCDGILVIDADCTLDPHSLRTFDKRLQKEPNEPLQLNYVVGNPDESATSYLLAVANCLENEFFYAPKEMFGGFVMLRGTGMYLPRTVLERFPWEAFSVVEDMDYSLQLLRHDISVGFVNEARVYSDFPVVIETLSVQRKRWIVGTFIFTLQRSLPLMLKGLFSFRKRRFDAGLSLLVISRPLLVFQLFCTTILTVLLVYPLNVTYSIVLLSATLCCYVTYFFYFWCGVIRLGLTKHRMGLLVALPLKIISYLGIAARSILGKRSTTWDRTPRK
jgi:cellulose synthase/poly-beta-1,6-N-acetylglucosamine synthase-like glycosyltransferase